MNRQDGRRGLGRPATGSEYADIVGEEKRLMPRSTLMLITGQVTWERQADIAAGRFPRKDYFELATALDADIIDHRSLPTGPVGRLFHRLLGADVLMAWEGFRRRRHYRLVYSDSEAIGIPLAMMLKLARDRQPHITIAHYLTPIKKQVFFRWLKAHSHINTIIVHASRQRENAVGLLRIPEAQVALLPYQVDERWWSPEAVDGAIEPIGPPAAETGVNPDWPIICSAGLERRDYRTLIEAVEGLPVRVVIAAASFWSKQQSDVQARPLPANVQIVSLDYTSLRELYARSSFVVMPLQDVDFQAGVTTILEAMAMGKAVIVTHSRGQEDVVIDRRSATRGPQLRFLPNGFGRTTAGTSRYGPTGLYVPPGDAAALRRAIRYLLDNPANVASLGDNGRRLATEVMSLDAFVERVAELATRCGHPDSSTSQVSMPATR